MFRDLFDIGLKDLVSAASQELSETGIPISEEALLSSISSNADILYSKLEEYIFNMRTAITKESINLQTENLRIRKECEENIASKDKEIEKARVGENKYKRLLEEEKTECIRQKEWNQALVKIIKDNGLELPKDIPHTYITPQVQPNSDNSSLPPSKNPIGYTRGYVKRPKSDKKPGGQPGHKGHTRLQEEHPTEIVECCPDICPNCNHPLEGVDGKVVQKRQVIDIPADINLDLVEYQMVEKKCPNCGAVCKGVFPDGVDGYVSYGVRVIATVVLLCHYMNCPWNKIISFFESVYKMHLSEGTIGNILATFALNCEEDYEKIRQKIEEGKIVHADETVITKDGKKRHVWIFITDDAVYIIYNKSRCMDVLFETFPNGLPNSVLVTDRFAAYFNKEFKVRNHQVCLPHLVRNCRGLENKAPNCKWVKDFKAFLEKAMKAKKDPSIDRDKLFLELDDLLDKEPEFCDPKERKVVIGFFNNMVKVKKYILLFLTDEDVPGDNNKAYTDNSKLPILAKNANKSAI